MGATVSDDDK
ncbi:hypothetical protein FPHYL_8908, partial [Fusarium phyllophilum]